MKMRLILALTAIVLFASPRASADPIAITGGSVFIGGLPFGPFPPFGVELLGDGAAIRAVTFDQANGFVEIGRDAGLSTVLNISTSTNSGPFDQLVRGVAFHDVVLQGTLNIVATPFIVSSEGPNTTPFTMTGELSLFTHVPFRGPGDLLFRTALTGSGTAQLTLARDLGGGTFESDGIGYEFSPAATPEPASVMLAVPAALALLVRRRRMTPRRCRPRLEFSASDSV